jgi:diguanylate cyclase (GGDEF)-like protein
MLKGLVARISLVFAIVATAACAATLVDALVLTNMTKRVRTLLARDLVEAVALTRSQNHLLRMNSNLSGAVLADKQDYEAARTLVSRSLADYLARMQELHDASPEAAVHAAGLASGFSEVAATANRAVEAMRVHDEAASRAIVASSLTPAVERQVERGRALINETWSTLETDRKATLALASVGWWEIVVLGAVSPLPALLALGWLAGPGLRRPMQEITDAANRLRGGDLLEPVAGRRRTDEVGSIALSLDMMRQEALRARDLAAAVEAAQLRDLTNAAFEGLAIIEGDIVSEANTSLANMLGLARDALIGHRLGELLTLDTGQVLTEVMASASLIPMRTMLALGDDRFPIEIQTRSLANSTLGPSRLVVAVRDLRSQAAAEARITHLAHHDALTGIANRVLLATRLREATALAQRTGRGFAVLCIDLNRFKPINDLYGHAVGDTVLCEVARRLQATTRQIDTVARVGGDEFVVLQSGVDKADNAADLAGRLVKVLQNGFEIGEKDPVSVSASIGIALYPDDGMVPDTLMANADSALYRVKQSSRSGFTFFQADRDAEQHERHLLEQDLRHAMLAGELYLVYQPQVICATGTMVGLETLIRWNHPVRGQVSPAHFIPIAESNGLIIQIGGWVLQQACAEAAGWDAMLRVAVNVSPRQLEHEGFPRFVAAVLAETGLDPSRLELEITENLLVRETDQALKVIQDLKALGVQVALDDFGTGYSSLGMLHNFPFDRLKIDRAFVKVLTDSSESRAIVTAVVALGRALNITVLAEGAETPAQFAILRDLDCDEVQGFLTGLPAPIAYYRHATHPAALSGVPPDPVLREMV